MGPRICLLMIVRNETHVLKKTLDLVVSYIDSFCICDTGSTDGTPDMIRLYFQERNITGHIFHDPWKDFSFNRTLAFQHVYNIRSFSDYVWVLDADDRLIGEIVFPVPMTDDAYFLPFSNEQNDIRYYRLQIFRSSLRWRYRGILHETVVCDSKPHFSRSILSQDFYIESRREGDRNRNPLKYLYDAQLLEHALQTERDPFLYSRYLYYTAKSYFDFHDYEKAIPFFEKRLLVYENQEWYFCHFFLAQCFYFLDSHKHASEIQKHYLSGFRCDPLRCECMYYLALFHQERKDYIKGHKTLALVKDLPLPTHTTQMIYPNLYQYRVHLLYLQLFSLLPISDRKSERLEWKKLLQRDPQVLERFDFRRYPVLIDLLQEQTTSMLPRIHERATHARLVIPNDWILSTSDLSWIDECLDVFQQKDNLFRLYLGSQTQVWGQIVSSPDPIGPFFERLHDKHNDNMMIWEKSTIFLHRGRASFEYGYDGFTKSCVTYVLTESMHLIDLLTAYFLFCVTRDQEMEFRISTQPLRSSVPLQGQWESPEAFLKDLVVLGRIHHGSFCRLDWICGNHWHAFQTFLGIIKNQNDLVITTNTKKICLMDILTYSHYTVCDYLHPLAPLCLVLDHYFHESVVWKDPLLHWDQLSLSGLSDSIKEVIFPMHEPEELLLLSKNSTESWNQVLQEMSCVRVRKSPHDIHGWVYLKIPWNYVLTRPILQWHSRWTELRRLVHYFLPRFSWEQINLSKSFKDSNGMEDVCAWVRSDLSKNSTILSLRESLFVPFVLSPSNNSVFFPHLHFIGCEIYYHPSDFRYGDAFNKNGFVKRMDSIPSFIWDENHEGDYVDKRFFETSCEILEWGHRRFDFVSMNVPPFASDKTPIYCLNLQRRPDRRNIMRKTLKDVCFQFVDAVDGQTIKPTQKSFHFYVGNYSRHCAGLLGCALSHLFLWQSLIDDPCHEYYVILEDDIELRREAPFFSDTTANFHTIFTNILPSLPEWDLLFLGYTRWNNHPSTLVEEKKLIVRPLSSEYIGGTFAYIIHKKCARFLVTVIEHFGMFGAIDNVMHYYCRHSTFLCAYELNIDLVTSPWVRPGDDESQVDSDIQRDATILTYNQENDFIVVKDMIPDAVILEKKNWKQLSDFAGYVLFSSIYIGFTSDHCLIRRCPPSQAMEMRPMVGITTFIHHSKLLSSEKYLKR